MMAWRARRQGPGIRKSGPTGSGRQVDRPTPPGPNARRDAQEEDPHPAPCEVRRQACGGLQGRQGQSGPRPNAHWGQGLDRESRSGRVAPPRLGGEGGAQELRRCGVQRCPERAALVEEVPHAKGSAGASDPETDEPSPARPRGDGAGRHRGMQRTKGSETHPQREERRNRGWTETARLRVPEEVRHGQRGLPCAPMPRGQPVSLHEPPQYRRRPVGRGMPEAFRDGTPRKAPLGRRRGKAERPPKGAAAV